jgi:hypothetical protein
MPASVARLRGRRGGFHAVVHAGLVTVAFLLACSSGDGGSDTADLTGNEIAEQAVAEYTDLARELEANRTEVLGEDANGIAAVGNRLFWTGSTFDPILHSFDEPSGEQVEYGFSIGSGDDANWRASAEAIATAIPQGGDVVYHLYAVDKVRDELDTFELPMPSYAKWWAYAVDGTTLYYVVTTGGAVLWRKPAGQPAEELFALERDCGVEVGEFWDFTVSGDVAMVVESGRVWKVDLTGDCDATWVGNETEVQAFSWDEEGVLYASATGPFWYDFASGETRDVAAEIAASGWLLNDTFAAAHLYASGAPAMFEHYAVYDSQHGIFAFDLDSGEVAPVLLDNPYDAPPYVTYLNPTMLANGTLYVQSLESDNGAVGADGPIYEVGWEH